MNNRNNIENLNWVSWLLIILAVLFAVFSLIPFLSNVNPVVDFLDNEPMSEAISDFVNPLIGIASIAMMFLAFYMQYRANKLVINQFELTQFENRFFELLKMHKENSKDVLDSFYAFREIVADNDPARVNGLRKFEYLIAGINTAYYDKMKETDATGYDSRQSFTAAWSSRWEDSFGHYFRHLFMLVRFVVSKKFLTYEQKRSYLRIIRTTLSTYEQVFLYYNWLSGDGRKWEDGENRFFTDYRIIHNIDPKLILPDFDIREISPFKELIASGDYMKEKGRTSDSLFEFESRTAKR